MKKQNHVLVNIVAFFVASLGFFTTCGPATPVPSHKVQVSADIHDIMKTKNFRQGVHDVQQMLAYKVKAGGFKKVAVTDQYCGHFLTLHKSNCSVIHHLLKNG
jgi:hypothetical protein